MIHLVLLSGIAILIFRVIWLIFGMAEGLFETISSTFASQASKSDPKPVTKPTKIPEAMAASKKTTTTQVPSKPKVESLIKIPETKVESPEKKEIPKKAPSLFFNNSDREEEKPVVLQVQTQSLLEVNSEKSPKDRFHTRLDENQLEAKISDSQTSSLETRVAQLNQELEKHKIQKQQYIERIEEIIQQIMNPNQLNSLTKYQTDDELSPINNLKHELNSANQRVFDQKNQLTSQFQNQRRKNTEEYQELIKNIVEDNQENIKKYTETIDEISNQVVKQSTQYQALLEEKVKESGEPTNYNELLLRQEFEKEARLEKEAYNELANRHSEQAKAMQGLLAEAKNNKIDLGVKSNDELQNKTQYEAQISSLQTQSSEINQELASEKQKVFKLEQNLADVIFKHQHDMIQTSNKQNSTIQNSEIIDLLEQKYINEKTLKEQEERKTTETIEELKFCQEQLKTTRETETELRDKLRKATIQSPHKSERSFVRKEDVLRHPEFLNLKRKLEQLEGKRLSPEAIEKRAGSSYRYSKEGRQVSPSFPGVAHTDGKQSPVSSSSEMRHPYRTGQASTIQTKTGHLGIPPMSSTIMAGRRYNTPNVKPVAQSTIHEGGILSQMYLGETNILDEGQRNFIIHEVSALKKITAKKTRLMYSSAQKVNKPITDYIVSTPNMILIAELENKKIVGAFTQNAFSKDNKLTHSSIVSKAIIFSLSAQTFTQNEGRGEIIHFEEGSLIWGNREFVVNCEEPLSISTNLNCQNAIYPTNFSSMQFFGSENGKIGIAKLEVHRIFFG